MPNKTAQINSLIKLIAPKVKDSILEIIAKETENEAQFLELLLKYNIAQKFDNKASWEDISYSLKHLIIDNHININALAADIDEFTGSDNMLAEVGKSFAKQGWAVCDFDSHPDIYYLSIVPSQSKNELKAVVQRLGFYVQFF